MRSMNLHNAPPCWNTSSFGHAAHPSSLEMALLGAHLKLCRGLHGRWFALRCGVETLNGFVASRLVTTLTLAALIIGAACLVS